MYRNPDEKQEFLNSVKKIVDEALERVPSSKSGEELRFDFKKRTLRVGAFLLTLLILTLFGTCAVNDVFPNPEPEKVQVLRALRDTVSISERNCRFVCEPFSVKKVDGSLCECSTTLLSEGQQIFNNTLSEVETQTNSN